MAIHVHNLVKRFGEKTVLQGIDFDAQDGEFVALLGPNGTGKTTLLRILATLTRPTRGEVQIAGYSLPARSSEVRMKLGLVSHQPLLYADLSAEENLFFYGRLYNVTDVDRRVSEILDLVDLVVRRKDRVRTFSRGMQQRLAIGRAILHAPEILLLDEPYTGLDQEACGVLDEILKQVIIRNYTVVMASHDLARAASLATRFDVLSNGRIQASIQRNQLPQDGLEAFYQKALKNSEFIDHGVNP